MMRAYDVIKKKRDGFELNKQEIDFIVKGAVSGEILPYQISAFLMAVYFKGMTKRETLDFTLAIANSGDKVNLFVDGVKADKHSTGGVGDKTSLIVAPVVSALGVKVLKMSGRGLGHTGGTVDKLESIKGFNVNLDYDKFIHQGEKVGVAIIGQTKNLAPADKIFYALRDVTATVDSIPLIASSIMGKKLAADDDVIVLDVKTGSGAFMQDYKSALLLAKCMIDIGNGAGKKTCAVISDMEQPLGKCVGNSLEVYEAISILKGEIDSDIATVSIRLSAEILRLSGFGDIDECIAMVKDCILSGKAYEKFKEFVSMQGGDLTEIESGDYVAKYHYDITAQTSGYVSELLAENVGVASLMLGAGRNRVEDKIDYKAGIILNKKVGDYVNKGEVVATLYASNESLFSGAKEKFSSGVKISALKPKKRPLIFKVI